MSTRDDDGGEASLQISADQARAAIRALIDAFDALTNSGEVRVQAGRAGLFTSVFGWWAWINNSSRLVLLAHDNGLEHEAAPNVRTILEHTVVMQWVIDDEQVASAAVEAKAAQDQRKLFDQATAQNWTIPASVTRQEPARQTMLDFFSLCSRYKAETFYIPYRLLSAYVHPSAKGSESYLDPDTQGLRNCVEKSSAPDLVLVAICLIQAAQAIDTLIIDQPLAAAITEANGPFDHLIKPLTRQ